MKASDRTGEAAAAERAAVRLLQRREHSRHELQRKLHALHHADELVDRVLDQLEQQRLLSEERFVESYIGQRSRKGYGPLRIRAELAGRGVAGQLIMSGLDSCEVEWQDLLDAVAQRRFKDQPTTDRRELARRGRFLEQRGFPPGLVRRYLDRVGRT